MQRARRGQRPRESCRQQSPGFSRGPRPSKRFEPGFHAHSCRLCASTWEHGRFGNPYIGASTRRVPRSRGTCAVVIVTTGTADNLTNTTQITSVFHILTRPGNIFSALLSTYRQQAALKQLKRAISVHPGAVRQALGKHRRSDPFYASCPGPRLHIPLLTARCPPSCITRHVLHSEAECPPRLHLRQCMLPVVDVSCWFAYHCGTCFNLTLLGKATLLADQQGAVPDPCRLPPMCVFWQSSCKRTR